MVTVSSLENIPTVSKLSDCLAISESSARDHKLGLGGEDGNNGVHMILSRSVNQNPKMRSDVHIDPTYCKVDRHLVGVVGAQNESSLFSSSLSDLVNHKLKLSVSANKYFPRQSSAITSQRDGMESMKPQEEGAGETINNLLPDEEELFSGIVDEMSHNKNSNAGDFDDFDLFTCSGGIELEGDGRSHASQQNVSYPWGINSTQPSVHAVDHASRTHSLSTPRLDISLSTPRLDISLGVDPSKSSYVLNSFQSPVRLSSIGIEFAHSEASQLSFPQLQLDNRCIPSFHPHSPQMQLHSGPNSIPENSVDSMAGIAEDIRHLSLNGHSAELSDGVFGHSRNGIQVRESMVSKSNSYQQQHLRSLLLPNSPSFLNNNHAHHLGGLPGSPGAQHFMMNMLSPVHHRQVGSAPVLKASLWDRQQIYAGESHEPPNYPVSAIRKVGVGIPGFSPTHPREFSSHMSLPHVHGIAEVSTSSGIPSPQQMSHMFHDRTKMIALSTSYGSPSERVRSRRNEYNLSYADRKHYELNIDRILHGEDTRTTLMIKNIPNKYTSKMLLATIDEHHRGKYDFIYLPIDFKNKCNMGYAFINMVDPLQIVAFHQTFDGRKWEKFNSEKVASLAYARIQGKGALIAHFQNSSLMNEDKRCRPILFHTDGPNAGDQEPFPMGTNFRPKPGRLQVAGREEED